MTGGARRPLYARALRLRHLRPSALLCFLFFEGTIALGVLAALTELVSWWVVIVLPVAVAVMVKTNDLVAGALAPGPGAGADPPAGAAGPPGAPGPVAPAGPDGSGAPPARGARQVSRDLTDAMDPVDSPRQRFRQSAHRRYR